MMQSVSAKQILSQNDYKKFQTFLEDACGIVLGEGKEYLVSSRLSRLIRENCSNSSATGAIPACAPVSSMR